MDDTKVLENFLYEDSDSYQNEISEIYSYSEDADFFANRNAFEELMEDFGLPLIWKHMVQEQQWTTIHNLIAMLEVSCRSTRNKSCRALAYLIQGNFGECETIEEQAGNSKKNVFLLFEQGILQSFIALLGIESKHKSVEETKNNEIDSNTTFARSAELRIVLSVLCTITETMYNAKDSEEPRIQALRNQFIHELSNPHVLIVMLLKMLNNVCDGYAPHFPVRKITLLIWKIILVTVGGTEEIRQLVAERRETLNLPPVCPPKVRKIDLINHLASVRQKFFGFVLDNDLETTCGLPEAILDGINVIKKHLYIALSDVYAEREEKIERFPHVYGELFPDWDQAPAEKLYRALVPRLAQYLVSLLKILFTASSSQKSKSDRSEGINIMAEIADTHPSSEVQAIKMSADIGRHKEIILKAASATVLLLLKHYKTNHVYQYEYISQQLMFANIIPLVLKFLNQDLATYILCPNTTISAIDFPACVIGEPELTSEALELYSFQPYCWRNMFTCINLIQIMNKVMKGRPQRIMMLVIYKSAGMFIKALEVKQPKFELYVLKMLKLQLKYLGRQWKKANMSLLSVIYQKVRIRLTDDWALGGEHEAKPWQFQGEEFILQTNIGRFHHRRYANWLFDGTSKSCFQNSIDKFEQSFFNSPQLDDEDYDKDYKLSETFVNNYEPWLENEVFNCSIDWNLLCEPTKSN